MKRKDFIDEHTETCTNSIFQISFEIEHCKMLGLTPYTDCPEYDESRPIGERWTEVPYDLANLDQLNWIIHNMQSQIDHLEKMVDLLEDLATAKNELASVDLYEFDD